MTILGQCPACLFILVLPPNSHVKSLAPVTLVSFQVKYIVLTVALGCEIKSSGFQAGGRETRSADTPKVVVGICALYLGYWLPSRRQENMNSCIITACDVTNDDMANR